MITDIEQIEPDFITSGIREKIAHCPIFFRMNYNYSRYYVTVEDEEVDWYPSVTSIIKSVIPTSTGLELLMMEKGKEFNTWMAELAHQGTFIHTEIGQYLLSREEAKYSNNPDEFTVYSFDYFEDRVKEYMKEKRLNYDVKKWDIELKPKIVSFIRFIIEHQIEPLAVEIIVSYKDDKLQYAGASDLLCYMTVDEKGYHGEVYKSGANKGMPKETKRAVRKLALVDFKSGTSGFFDEYGIQLELYKRAFYQMSGIEVDSIINVGPTKFMNGNTPGYSLKDWTGLVDEKKVDLYLQIFQSNYTRPDRIAVYRGEITGKDDLESIFRYEEADQFVRDLAKVSKTLEYEKQTI